MTTEEAIRRGYLRRHSRYHRFTQKLDLRTLLLEVEGDILVGPAPDLAHVACRMIASGARGTVVDLCCGTAATALAVRAAGARRVIAVDRDLRAASENLKGRTTSVHLVKGDYRTWLPRGRVDFVVFDPPRMTRGAIPVVRRWRTVAHAMVTWVGAAGEGAANGPIKRALERESLVALPITAWNAEDVALAFTERGRRWVEALAP